LNIASLLTFHQHRYYLFYPVQGGNQMTGEEKIARLNLVRYGMLLTVVMAIAITPSALYLAGAAIGAIMMPTIIATVLAAIVAAGVYFGYSKYLDQS
jgi:hypothetical protein